jgi:cysteine desulfurase
VAGSGYFDAAAGLPLHPVARQAMEAAAQDGWADPGKLYAAGRRARQLLDAARAALAEELRARPDEVWLCASGTAAVQAAVRGVRLARSRLGETVVHSAVEHSAVLYEAATGPSVAVPVDRLGRVDAEAFATAVGVPGVAVAALISASHEVGTVQPVEIVAQSCADSGVPLVVDAAQTVGRLAVPEGWSALAVSARKWGGPTGVGILVVRKGVRWVPPWPGAEPGGLDQPGGLNLPAVVGAAAALRAVAAQAHRHRDRLHALVDRIRRTVAATVPDVEVVGDPDDRLPHLVTFSCLYVDGEALLHALDRAGFAVSSGSSCTASTLRPSHVLEAMGVLTHGNIRLSLPPDVEDSDVDRFLDVLPGIVADLRAEAGVVGL